VSNLAENGNRNQKRTTLEKLRLARKSMIGIIFLLVLGLIISAALFELFNTIDDFIVIMAILSFTFIFLSGFVIYLSVRINKLARLEKELEEMRALENPERRFGRLMDEMDDLITDSEMNRRGMPPKKSTRPLAPILINVKRYEGKTAGKMCGVCKLEVRSDQELMICVKCLTIFHIDHLSDWLKSAKVCPVCGQEMVLRYEI